MRVQIQTEGYMVQCLHVGQTGVLYHERLSCFAKKLFSLPLNDMSSCSDVTLHTRPHTCLCFTIKHKIPKVTQTKNVSSLISHCVQWAQVVLSLCWWGGRCVHDTVVTTQDQNPSWGGKTNTRQTKRRTKIYSPCIWKIPVPQQKHIIHHVSRPTSL